MFPNLGSTAVLASKHGISSGTKQGVAATLAMHGRRTIGLLARFRALLLMGFLWP